MVIYLTIIMGLLFFICLNLVALDKNVKKILDKINSSNP